MRTRPLQPTLEREEGVLQIEEVHQGEGILPEREASPELRWKKDISKIRCYECHDFGHYAS
jgi:hypothetical protein